MEIIIYIIINHVSCYLVLYSILLLSSCTVTTSFLTFKLLRFEAGTGTCLLTRPTLTCELCIRTYTLAINMH